MKDQARTTGENKLHQRYRPHRGAAALELQFHKSTTVTAFTLVA